MHRTRPLAFLDTATLITLGVVLCALAAWAEVSTSASGDPGTASSETAVAFADEIED